jgi:hypothetical protein
MTLLGLEAFCSDMLDSRARSDECYVGDTRSMVHPC